MICWQISPQPKGEFTLDPKVVCFKNWDFGTRKVSEFLRNSRCPRLVRAQLRLSLW